MRAIACAIRLKMKNYDKKLASVPLFEQPLAHRADPQTSYDAIPDANELSRQEREVYDAGIKFQKEKSPSRFYPDGITARELADRSKLDYHLIQRRMSGLRNKSKAAEVKVCGKVLTRDGYQVWRFIK